MFFYIEHPHGPVTGPLFASTDGSVRTGVDIAQALGSSEKDAWNVASWAGLPALVGTFLLAAVGL